MNVEQFNYELPPNLIAQTPAEPRDASRLMVVNRKTGDISHHVFAELPQFLQAGDTMIANDSRVLPARLFGRKKSGGKVEFLLLKQQAPHKWEVLVGGKRLRPGVEVTFANKTENLTATIKADLGGARRLVSFSQPVEQWLAEVGHVPLPPYIQQPLTDPERYQTIFSRAEGSAAAPTAGLHFTPELLLRLREQRVSLDYVTLHIGLDTFKPVTVSQVEEHAIHREVAQLTSETARRINQTRLKGGQLVAIGTTTVRTLETAALRAAGQHGSLRQASKLPVTQCGWQTVASINEETDLFIYPGYQFRAVDSLVTNFHLPKSSLLMLVSAFAGPKLIERAYQVAIAKQYRFYSFGDAMLIL